MNKNILICLNRLDIGGIETVVVNQTIELLERGYNVVVLSKKGIYSDVLTKKGAKCIEFDFNITDGYDLENSEKVEKIINENQINEVHIQQFDCVSSVFPACLKTNTPYVAYVHTGIRGTYDWFERSFQGYNGIFNMYFNLANKIITITEEAKKENMEYYNVPEEKYIIRNNSIRFDEKMTENNTVPTKIEKFLIISRLSEEKFLSIKNSIKIFKSYYKENKNATLTIVGNGNYLKQIENEVKDIKDVTTFLGARSDVLDIMLESDAIIGLDRCILEGIASKRIAIISGYEKTCGLVTQENIRKAADNNFSGRNLEETKIEEITKSLLRLNKESIEKLVNENYKFAYENLNTKTNIYVIGDIDKKEIKIDKDIYLKDEQNLAIRIKKAIERADNVYKECKETQKYFESQIDGLEKENKNLREYLKNWEDYEEIKTELEKIKYSKTYKYSKKIVDIFKKNKKTTKD